MADNSIDDAQVNAEKKLQAAMRKVFSSEEGIIVLHYLMVECGYQMRSVVADRQTQQIFTESTIYNEARRNLYLQIRRYLTPKILTPVELEGLLLHKKPIIKKAGSNVKRLSKIK